MIGYLIPMRLASEVLNAQVTESCVFYPKERWGAGKAEKGQGGEGGVGTHTLPAVCAREQRRISV